ncbi:MAG: ChaN family lipoprotein [Nitrospirota bacterium]
MNILLILNLFLVTLFWPATGTGENSRYAGQRPYELFVSFDIKENLVKGIARVELQKETTPLYIGRLRIISVILNGRIVKPDIKDGILTVRGSGKLEIGYEGVFKKEGLREDPENPGVVIGNFIGDEGIYLTEAWYPSLEDMIYFKLKAVIPRGFTAISEADEVSVTEVNGGVEYLFDFPYPVKGINLVAGKYKESKEMFRGINICSYFFPEDVSLAKTYIEYTKKYLEIYEGLLIPFPFKRFCIVENFLPTGYSMPTFTLLGQDVVRLPFIVETSLGHEILHQWFGNLVYIDYRTGNWSEGLTTYLSDHLYKEKEGKGWEYRKKILTDYKSYVTPEKEFALREFKGRTDYASKAIGYGKGAMVFHMLKNLIGEDSFYGGLRQLLKEKEFEETSWKDLRMTFEQASGTSLDWFFSQWLDRKGIPSLRIRDPNVTVMEGIPKVLFDIVQDGEPYLLGLPILIKTDREEVAKILDIRGERKKIELSVTGNPQHMVFDRNYDVMRDISDDEYPPLISRLLGDDKRIVVLSEKESEKYDGLTEHFEKLGFTLKEEADVSDKDIMGASMLITGCESRVLRRLLGETTHTAEGFIIEARKNPLNISKVVAIACGETKQEVDLAARKIPHYRNYSNLRFVSGQNVEKKTGETERGIKVNLYEPVLVMHPQNLVELDSIVNKILDKPVIYIGERHANYEDHKVQLRVIMDLHEKNRKIAIGMEMFQKPFQSVIDEYIAGNISEKEFLKGTEYFERWQFDYVHYREIVQFARAMNMPLIALNLRSEIIKKVSAKGLDSLDDEEMKEIPEDMDMTDEDYRKRLKEIFEQHRNHETRNFDYFYQSQILWDETMAHSIADFLQENPDYQMVVLAGVGHIMYGAGIPKRARRLTGRDFVTVIPLVGPVNMDVGDLVFMSEQVSPPTTFKLGVVLRRKDAKVEVEKVVPGSIAKHAGIDEGDILISLDDWKIEKIEDIKIFMVGKKRGDHIKIKILRKKFLSGYKEINLETTI